MPRKPKLDPEVLAQLSEEIVDDPDNREWTEEDFARAKPVDELEPELRDAILAAFPNTKRRDRQRAPTKVRTTIRLSPNVRSYFQELAKAQGRPWQTLINEHLDALVSSKS